MNVNVEIRLDESQIERVNRLLRGVADASSLVQVRAMNSAAKRAKTRMSTYVRGVLNIAKKDLDQYIDVDLATHVTLKARMFIDRKDSGAVRLGYFGKLKQTPVGSVVKIYKSKPARTYPGAFVATMKSGHEGVWKRETYRGGPGQYDRRPWKRFERKYRLPIEPIWGPKLRTIVGNHSVYPRVYNEVQDYVVSEIDRLLDVELRKL